MVAGATVDLVGEFDHIAAAMRESPVTSAFTAMSVAGDFRALERSRPEPSRRARDRGDAHRCHSPDRECGAADDWGGLRTGDRSSGLRSDFCQRGQRTEDGGGHEAQGSGVGPPTPGQEGPTYPTQELDAVLSGAQIGQPLATWIGRRWMIGSSPDMAADFSSSLA